MFIVMTNHVLSYQASGADQEGLRVSWVKSARDAVMDWHARDIAVARDDALCISGVDEKGACFAYEGHKSSVHTHLNYLATRLRYLRHPQLCR